MQNNGQFHSTLIALAWPVHFFSFSYSPFILFLQSLSFVRYHCENNFCRIIDHTLCDLKAVIFYNKIVSTWHVYVTYIQRPQEGSEQNQTNLILWRQNEICVKIQNWNKPLKRSMRKVILKYRVVEVLRLLMKHAISSLCAEQSLHTSKAIKWTCKCRK